MNSKKVTLKDLLQIRSAIQQIDIIATGSFKDLLDESELLSITQPVFFDELNILVEDIAKNKIKGDFIEAGVWCGATAIYIKALLNYYNLNSKLWLLDGFEDPIDFGIYHKEKDRKALEIILNWDNLKFFSEQEVITNFKKFELWDENILTLKGDIFKTYTKCNPPSISLLRLDFDFYESTLFMLENFYNKITKGGYVIIDDYGVDHFNCKDAVDEFRKDNNITSELKKVGNFVAYWKK